MAATYNEKVHDSDFCINGLIWPDRTPHPALWECKYLKQPLKIALVESPGHPTLLKIINRQDFTDISWLTAEWELFKNGVSQIRGTLTLPVLEPDESSLVPLPCAIPASEAGIEYHLNIRVLVKNNQSWCQAGHIIAEEQLLLSGAFVPRFLPSVTNQSEALVGSDSVVSGSLKALIDNNEIILKRVSPDLLLLSGLELNLWRAATDNDGIREWSGQEDKPLGQWLKAGLNQMKLVKTEYNNVKFQNQKALEIKKTYQPAEHLRVTEIILTLIPQEQGGIYVQTEVRIPDEYPTLPRIGLIMTLPEGFEQLSWYGRGPRESYRDRDGSSFFAVYDQNVEDQFVP